MTDTTSIDPWLDEWSRPTVRHDDSQGGGDDWLPLLAESDPEAAGPQSWLDGPLSKLTSRLAAAHTAQQRMLDDVRTLHRALQPGESSDTAASGTTERLLVAPLDVPDRITKRNYNYFNELNSALLALKASSDGAV
jgi:hypothetical protein